MHSAIYASVRAWYGEFVRGYADETGRLPFALRLKLAHCGHVARDCRQMARELGWSPEEVILADLAGWLHDAARFPQFREYATFHDGRSINHGARGRQLLEEQQVLDALPAADRSAVLDAVAFHNRREIPAGLPEPSLRLLRLVRDADKLDIFRIVQEAIARDYFRQHPELLLHLDLAGPVTPALLDQVRAHITPAYALMRTLADFLIVQVSWLYDLNYAPAFARVLRRRILDQMEARLPADPGVREIFDSTRHHARTHAVGN